ATWHQADSQAKQVLDPILAPTPEGKNLADILLDMGKQIDGTVLSRPVMGAFTRYVLGDRIAGWLEMPREPVWGPMLRTVWLQFIAARQLGAHFPGAQGTYWLVVALLRKAVLVYLSEGDHTISIEIPTENRPS